MPCVDAPGRRVNGRRSCAKSFCLRCLRRRPGRWDPSCTDEGDRASTDGFYAGGYRDRRSYGYRPAELGASVTVAVTADLGEAQGIARASHHDCGAPGYRPDRMTVAVSADAETWVEVGSTEMVSGGLMIVDFAEMQARFVRFEFVKRRSGSSDERLFPDEMEAF